VRVLKKKVEPKRLGVVREAPLIAFKIGGASERIDFLVTILLLGLFTRAIIHPALKPFYASGGLSHHRPKAGDVCF